MSTKRIFAMKKDGFQVEGERLLDDIRLSLDVPNLKAVSVVNCYDCEGLDDDTLELARNTVFAEPQVDRLMDTLELMEDETAFAVCYIPGQYDQRADSAEQCLQVISQKSGFKVLSSKIIILKGRLTDEEVAVIKSYCINPVDSMEMPLEKPESLQMEFDAPKNVEIVRGFIEMSVAEIREYHKQNGFAMSETDLLFCRNYFKDVEYRDPSITELRVIDTYWSDHCRHTTFLTEIEDIQLEDGDYKPLFEKVLKKFASSQKIKLMDIATRAAKDLKADGYLTDLDESEEINACSIQIDVDVDGNTEPWLLMFKNETHNHPTEIEPFGGAATCLGGAIRDPLSGRSYVYQAMRITGSGDPRNTSDTLQGKLPQRKITKGAAHGYSSYGNQIGIATGFVKEIYHPGYVAKRMEIGAVIGAAPKENIRRERPVEGDIVILVGGRTGRDGIGGATGSSKEHTGESLMTCGAEVQKGNPPTERKLQRLFRNKDAARLIKRCNDFGAGGVSVAIGELAAGLKIELDEVLKKYEGMDGTELAISESQERMAVVVSREHGDEFISLARQENLESVVVAEVTREERLVMNWQNQKIVDISRAFLDTNGARQTSNAFIKMPIRMSDEVCDETDTKEKWLDCLSDLNVASQKGLVEMFDHTIGAATVFMPYGGKYRLSETQVMAAKIPVEGDTSTTSLMSYGYDPEISTWSPFHGAAYAVVESVSKIVAVGGDYKKVRLTFQEYFERLGSDPEKWGKPLAALLGAYHAQMELKTPAIGGKDSMSGTFLDLNVPPTLVSFAVAVESADSLISPELKASEHWLYYIPSPKTELDIPDFDKLKENFELIRSLISDGVIVSAYALQKGGVAEAVSKMSFGNKIGVDISSNDIDLFAPAYGGFVVESVSELSLPLLGRTCGLDGIRYKGMQISFDELLSAWQSALESTFPTEVKVKPEMYSEREANTEPLIKNHANIIFNGARPRVLITAFPGTNCEDDSRRAFERAGAEADVFVMRNLTINELNDSIRELADKISKAQMLMIPGGFSAGDEPEGSAKFIACVFQNKWVKEEVDNLLEQRDGLMLGICNGFQALLKLGLLPHGRICPTDEFSPTLTFNSIGRHVSCLVNTKITSNRSPWLYGVEVGDEHTVAVSHGEGRFVANEETVARLFAKGQVATQYIGIDGDKTASSDIRYNPNGSVCAIEGLISSNGRVFGKMGHSERKGAYLYKNCEGNFDQRIFESGVGYYL